MFSGIRHAQKKSDNNAIAFRRCWHHPKERINAPFHPACLNCRGERAELMRKMAAALQRLTRWPTSVAAFLKLLLTNLILVHASQNDFDDKKSNSWLLRSGTARQCEIPIIFELAIMLGTSSHFDMPNLAGTSSQTSTGVPTRNPAHRRPWLKMKIEYHPALIFCAFLRGFLKFQVFTLFVAEFHWKVSKMVFSPQRNDNFNVFLK